MRCKHGDGLARHKGIYEYSLWLMPNARFARKAAALMTRLATENNTVIFKPHVTLLGYIDGDRMEIKQIAKRLSGQIGKIKAVFTGLRNSDTYTRPIFVNVKGSRELFAARRLAENAFGHKRSIFKPHMSLMYAKLDRAGRLKILEKIDENLFSEDPSLDTMGLYARRWDGKEWKPVASFRLH